MATIPISLLDPLERLVREALRKGYSKRLRASRKSQRPNGGKHFGNPNTGRPFTKEEFENFATNYPGASVIF